jgi:hypothetical protein
MLTLTDGNVAQIGAITIISAISMTCLRREWYSNRRYERPLRQKAMLLLRNDWLSCSIGAVLRSPRCLRPWVLPRSECG